MQVEAVHSRHAGIGLHIRIARKNIHPRRIFLRESRNGGKREYPE